MSIGYLTPLGMVVEMDYLRTWLRARNALRRATPNPAYKFLHDLDALGPLLRDAPFHDRLRIEAIERRYLARLNRRNI